MIPLLALGIPGDVITAVILGAFMIHGLRPGPILFDQNLPMIYALFMGILLSSFYLFFVGKIAIKFFSRVATVPNRILYPIVFVFWVYGAYAVNINLFDVLVILVMGLVGYGTLRLDIPVAPFLIANVLGPLLEDNFRQSLLIADGDNTICIVLWGLTCLSLFVLIRSRIQAARTGKASRVGAVVLSEKTPVIATLSRRASGFTPKPEKPTNSPAAPNRSPAHYPSLQIFNRRVFLLVNTAKDVVCFA